MADPASGGGLRAFAQVHAIAFSKPAELPFSPDRALSGQIGGKRTAALVISGDGTRREDRIAVVAGPKGPIASSELRASPAGLSATDIDRYATDLIASLGSKPPASS